MVSTTVDEGTGEEKKRLINRMRWKGYGPASIMFTDANVRIRSSSCQVVSSFYARSQTSHLSQLKKGEMSSTRRFFKSCGKYIFPVLLTVPL